MTFVKYEYNSSGTSKFDNNKNYKNTFLKLQNNNNNTNKNKIDQIA